MSEKRKDNKGRVLRNGESQRKDGKYEYKYIDSSGERRSVYSWKLVETDKLPKGKRECVPLRELEKIAEQETKSGLRTFEIKKCTLNEYFDQHMSKRALRLSTRNLYLGTYERHIRNSPLGIMLFTSIKSHHIKNLMIDAHMKKGLSFNSISDIYVTLAQTFASAVKDKYILENPTHGVLKEIRSFIIDDSKPKEALTKRQQEIFSNYVAKDKFFNKWSALFTFLLGTGCRIGEALALQWEDCDFKSGVINISRNLVYTYIGGRYNYHIGPPKNKSSIRKIPMLTEVREALLNERDRQMQSEIKSVEVCGYKNFVFINKYGNIRVSNEVSKITKKVVCQYNNEEIERAKKENREPELLPKITPHIFRHTFCTRYCELENNVKLIQEVMGHSRISTTMNVYNTVTNDERKRSFMNLEKNMQITSPKFLQG